MPLIALLIVPMLACFVGGVVAAAARTTVTLAGPREWPDNIIPFDQARRRA